MAIKKVAYEKRRVGCYVMLKFCLKIMLIGK